MQDSRRRFWLDLPAFADLAALNFWLEERCLEEWGKIAHGSLPGSIAEVQAAERASLMPVGRPFDGFIEHSKRVSPTCLIHFDRNRYSVPAGLANLPVSLRVYSERLVVVAEGEIVCEHQRIGPLEKSLLKPFPRPEGGSEGFLKETDRGADPWRGPHGL